MTQWNIWNYRLYNISICGGAFKKVYHTYTPTPPHTHPPPFYSDVSKELVNLLFLWMYRIPAQQILYHRTECKCNISCFYFFINNLRTKALMLSQIQEQIITASIRLRLTDKYIYWFMNIMYQTESV